MENTSESKKIEIEQETINDLDSTRKWTMFLAIMGFIGIGIILSIGLFAGVFLSIFKTGDTPIGITEGLVFIPVLIVAVIYFFPVLFLFRFSKHTTFAVKNLDKQALSKAIKNLKSYYIFLGILVIILITAYVFAFIAAGASFGFLKDLGTGV